MNITDWMEESVFKNKDGTPLVWFHGTDSEVDFNVFTKTDDYSIGFHFGNADAANDRINEMFRMVPRDENAGVIIPVICRAKSPLRLPDLYEWSLDQIADAMLNCDLIDDVEHEWLVQRWRPEDVFAVLEEKGYDSVVYLNECEHKEGKVDSIFVWRAELLKSSYAATFDPNDPRLLPQNETSEVDMENWEILASEIEAAKEEYRGFVNQCAVIISS